jgi:hypothetical protein
MTLCSPTRRLFVRRKKINVLQVSLPTNFKVARFDSNEHTAMLRQMQSDVEAIRFDSGAGVVELPVKLKVHDSLLCRWRSGACC